MRDGFWSYPSILIQIILAILTIAYGTGVFFFYVIRYEINIAVCSFFVAIFSLSVVYLHTLFLRNDLDLWFEPDSFNSIRKLSAVFLFFGIFGLAINLALAYLWKEELNWSGHYFAAIIYGILVFWCTILILSTRKYKRFVELSIPYASRAL